MIPQKFIDEVQARTDIAEVISGYIPLKKAGRNYKAVCPFHSEKTPSFVVSPQKQIFHCFGCGEGGGVIHFLMLYEKITFVEAVEQLAARCGLKIPFQRTSPQEKTKSFLYEIVGDAASFYAGILSRSPKAAQAREYLQKRGIGKETVKEFRLGYASSQLPLIEYMKKKDVRLAALEQASLVVSRSGGGYRDLFRDRIMFPIADVRSRVIGFGARLLRDKEDAPKYINSVESPLYSKRAHLYGLNLAKDAISKAGHAVVVEGYLDMITPFSRGIKNIVASLGTALTSEQIRLLKRYTQEVVLVYDSDTAGQSANVRALDLLLAEGMRIGIVRLPQGHDPDSLVREKGKEGLLALIGQKADFFDYKVGVLAATLNKETIKGKTMIAQEMLATIDRISSEVEKYEYIKRLSFYLSVREEVLLLELNNLRKTKKRHYDQHVPKATSPVPLAEKRVVQFMLSSRKAMSLVEKNLDESDFTHPLSRKTATVLFTSFAEDKEWSASSVMSRIEDQEITRFFSEILMEDGVSLSKELLRECIVKMRGRRIKGVKDTLRKELKEAEARNDREKAHELIEKIQGMQKISEVKKYG